MTLKQEFGYSTVFSSNVELRPTSGVAGLDTISTANSFAKNRLYSWRSGSATHCIFSGYAAGGSEASPAHITTSDSFILGLTSYVWNSTAWVEQGRIGFYSDGAHNVSNLGTYATIEVTPNNSLTRSIVATFRSSGLSVAGAVTPSTANTYDIGSASLPWANIRAQNGAIVTSDETLKAWRGPLNEQEIRAAIRIANEIGIYQWLEKVESEGPDNARLHTGVRAQQAISILTEEGLDWRRYGWACLDEWTEQDEITVPIMETRKVVDAEGNDTGEEEEYDTGMTRVVQPAIAAGSKYSIRDNQLIFFILAGINSRLSALDSM